MHFIKIFVLRLKHVLSFGLAKSITLFNEIGQLSNIIWVYTTVIAINTEYVEALTCLPRTLILIFQQMVNATNSVDDSDNLLIFH